MIEQLLVVTAEVKRNPKRKREKKLQAKIADESYNGNHADSYLHPITNLIILNLKAIYGYN